MFAKQEKKRLTGGASDSDLSVSAPREGRMTGHGHAAARPSQALACDQGRGPLYVSAKRTQFISFGKPYLYNWSAMNYAVRKWSNNVGSFLKTNPISGGMTGHGHEAARPSQALACDQG